MVKYTYNAWGECITTVVDSTCEAIANLNPFRYRSYYLDTETNLYFLKTRYYDPEVGRFITIDDTSYLAPDTVNGLNLYAYCGNNPVMRVDPNGCFFEGLFSQIITSIVSYAGMAIASLFDEEIKADMDRIGWNPFNSSENAVINSSKVSFYKGAPVFRTEFDRSASFFAIFLRKGASKTEVKHERGHNTQAILLGPAKYALTIGLPSALELSKRSYYERPWEITADVFGGVKTRKHNADDIAKGFRYLITSYLFGPLAYSFIADELLYKN